MNIVLTEPLTISKEKLDSLKCELTNKGHSFASFNQVAKSDEELKERIKDADIIIIANSKLSGDVIRSTNNLKYISVAFTGVDHVDLEACKEKGIRVSNCSGYSTESVAELAIGLMISFYRHINEGNEATKNGKDKKGLIGNTLNDKTVGVIGLGAIGEKVARILTSFNCRVLGYNRHEKNIEGVKQVSLEELLRESDIISVHVPLNNETRHLLNESNLKLLKRNALVINTARGPVIDYNCLADMLNNDLIQGACLDVYEKEPPLDINEKILNAKNVITLPHVAYFTEEAMTKRSDLAFNNVEEFLKGNIINKIL